MKPYQFIPAEAAAFIGAILIIPFFALALVFVAVRELVRPTA